MSEEKLSGSTSLMENVGRFTRNLFMPKGVTIPVVRLHGVINADQKPGRINIQMVQDRLERAFKMRKSPAVAIIVNSPGGSPVQSRLVSKRIRDLAEKYDKQVLMFVEDVAASGGYFIAVAGDEIYADPSSIVGSIGVIMASFGFVQAIEKLGIERRVYTAGKNKSMLDPFLPEKKADITRIKQYETDIHQIFIDWVKEHRGDKLKATDDELFTGEFWPAVRGLDLGLIDAIGDVHEVLRDKFGKDVRLKNIDSKKPLLRMPMPFGMNSSSLGVDLASGMVAEVEERALWSRYGL